MFFSSFFIIVPVARATIDGEPHEMLTSIVCTTGIIIAVIIISVLVFLLHKMKTIPLHLQSQKTNATIDLEAQAPKIDDATGKEPTQPSYSSEMKVFSISAILKQNQSPPID